VIAASQAITTTELDERSFRYAGWRVALSASGCVFVSFASLLVYTFSVFLKPWTEAFGWSRESASIAFGIAALTVAVCSPPLGYLLDRYPARRIILPCITVFGCAFASLALMTRHIWHLYAVFFVLGIVGSGTAQLAYSRALTTWFQQRRGAAFAVLMTGGAIGATILPPVAQALIDIAGWRSAVAILGAMLLAVGWPLGLRVKERDHTVIVQRRAACGATVGEGLRSRIFWIVVAVLFCASISQNGAITHLSAMLTDRGVSPGGALVLSAAQSMAAGVAGASLMGIGMGGEADVTPYLLAKYLGQRAFSTLYALTWTAYAIAGAIGPVIMGKVFDATGSYQSLLVQLTALTAASSFLMLLLPRYTIAEAR
jgi:MFS family permease